MKGDRVGEFEELTLLAVQALGAEPYAVAIQRFIERTTGRDVVIGAVYATLERLERKGFLRSAFGEATPVRGGKAKRLYTTTSLGKRTLWDLRTQRDAIWREIEGTSR